MIMKKYGSVSACLRKEQIKTREYSMRENRLEAGLFRLFTAVVFLISLFSGYAHSNATTEQKEFHTAEEAVEAFVGAMKAGDEKELLAIFGPEAEPLISSGDEVNDRQRRERFVENYNRGHSLSEDGGRMILLVGEQQWPFPIPLVKTGDLWSFDTAAGREEILNRRIGENELFTIQVMLAVVDAQREYALQDHGGGLLEYARKFGSDPGKKNGLYWKTKEGEKQSPLGELVAKARAEGYGPKGSKEEPAPYHGYFYRMLMAQGKNAPGGAYDYIVNDKMIGGFAVVAYPAEYGTSGVMTFIVSHDGVVYQKDLGGDTEKLAKAMKVYDPDKTWTKAQ